MTEQVLDLVFYLLLVLASYGQVFFCALVANISCIARIYVMTIFLTMTASVM